jgi:O-succinylbenzoate synthase
VGIEQLELIHARLPLVRPFTTRHGTRAHKDVLYARVRTRDGAVGWGECAAEVDPTYAPEYLDGVRSILRDQLGPRLLSGVRLDEVAGNHMAKATLEMAALDARLQGEGRSLASWLGGTRDRVPVGVVVEHYDDPGRAADVAARHVDEGYRRIKLKIAPGSDVDVVNAVRPVLGRDVALWADANGAYTLADAVHLDALDVELLEQPLRAGDILEHAALRSQVRAAVCLDESIASYDDARVALHLHAAGSLALKAGRLGGLESAVAVHDICLAAGVPVWCGGMLETGIGRAANLALASLPGFTLPGDISATRRYFSDDVTEPFILGHDGSVSVPSGPGLGVVVDESFLAAVTISRERVSGR